MENESWKFKCKQIPFPLANWVHSKLDEEKLATEETEQQRASPEDLNVSEFLSCFLGSHLLSRMKKIKFYIFEMYQIIVVII
jgi:hypothetical protein